ncbi:MAG: lysophospholipid acyltransferase family protein [Acidobacteria bacterium]|jgi:KDO2-lipid IV(A) lauroyltransferase|nr:lysophospholipid acyltransferase family protein [Acidobacteriota bacterium]
MAFIYMVKASPFFLVSSNKRILSFLGRQMSKRYRGIVEKNLEIAFPEHSETENSQLKDAIYNHFASIFIDIIYMFVKKRPDKVLKTIEVHNFQALEKALEKKKGVILFSAHFGNWELVPFILSRRLNTTIISIAREMNNPLVERRVKQFREKMGSTIVYKKNSLRTILKMLEQNRVVYLLIDQNTIGREAVFIDFFGKKVGAVPSVSQLYLKKNVPVIPLFLHYENDKIILELLPEIEFKGSSNLENDIQELTQECNRIIEENIRKYPEQWFWFHNRWKTKPLHNNL